MVSCGQGQWRFLFNILLQVALVIQALQAYNISVTKVLINC